MFLHNVVLQRYDGDENRHLPALLATLEPDYLDAWLNQFADEVLHDFPSDFVTLLLETGARPDVGWKISVRSAASRH